MATTLTGSTATDPTTAPTLSAPAAGDAVASGPMGAALQKLLDAAAWIRANMGPLGAANTWTGTELFQAAVTLSALLTANANVALTKAGDQTILKGGSGKLQIGTSIATDLELLVGGAAKLAVLAAGGIDAKSGKIVNLADGAAATDAATFGQTIAQTTTTITPSANWNFGTNNVARSGKLVEVQFSAVAQAGAANFVLGTLPSGYRPALSRSWFGTVALSGGNTYPCWYSLTTGGVLSAQTYWNGTTMVSLPVPTSGDTIFCGLSFLAA